MCIPTVNADYVILAPITDITVLSDEPHPTDLFAAYGVKEL